MFPVFRSALGSSSRRLILGCKSINNPLLFMGNSPCSLIAGRSGAGTKRTFHFGRNLLNSIKRDGGSVSSKAVDGTKAVAKKPSLKELTKKYGWAAVGVYFGLSAIDLPICFLFVHSLGKERVQELERAVKGFFGFSTKTDDLSTATEEENNTNTGTGDNKGEETNWSLFITEFTIAYAIHKSVFIFVRIPATAAITPWVVKKLRTWGFNIGGKAIEGAAKFGTSPSKRQKWFSWFS